MIRNKGKQQFAAQEEFSALWEKVASKHGTDAAEVYRALEDVCRMLPGEQAATPEELVQTVLVRLLQSMDSPPG